jgi:uncharacterized protein (DUF2235 family)
MKANGRRDEEHARWQMRAQAQDEGRVYQAGRDQHVTVHVHGEQRQAGSAGHLRNALAPLYVLLGLVGLGAFAVGGLTACLAFWRSGLSVMFFQSCGISAAGLALVMTAERIFTGRWHRWSRTRGRARRP